MDKLIADIKIKLPVNGREVILQNLEINSGVALANSELYYDYAVIPKTNWRPLSQQEQDILFTETLEVESQVVSVLDLDDDLKESFSNFDKAVEVEDLMVIYHQLLTEDEDFKYGISSFLKDLLKPGESLGTLSLLCLAQLDANMDTVAFDNKTGIRFGLHFDRSSGASLFEKKLNKSRISINLGQEHRYIMFINLGIEKVFELVKQHKPEIDETIDEVDLASHFFELYPDYPVIRYRQERFQCYVAPTDYIIHDGSTLNKTTKDRSMVYLGYFNTGGVN